MERVTVVGSGASGVHFALTLLRKGYPVTLLDVGESGAPEVLPDEDFEGLKRHVADPVQYFLGRDYETVTFTDDEGEFYGFPPSKRYLFRRPAGFALRAEGFEPLLSFARGGLAEAWTGGVFPFSDAELSSFPFSYNEISPHYAEVARRIGICGRDDDLARFTPLHDHISEPLELDAHSRALLAGYARHRRYLNDRLRVFLGMSRIAVLSQDRNGRQACGYLGRCLWGCPRQALYTPSLTLEECRAFPAFDYRPSVYVESFRYDVDRRIHAVVARPPDGTESIEFPVDTLALAAGTLASTRIFLESIYRIEGRRPRLTGLMDNRQVLVPFLNLGRIGATLDEANYQYHQVCLGLPGEAPAGYVHALVTTLTTALAHPVLQRIPLDTPTALFVFRHVRAALGIVNLNLHDTRRPGSWVELEEGPLDLTLRITSAPPADEPERLRDAILRVRKALRRLGCIIPPGGIHVRPIGSSVHYAGTLPMSTETLPFTTSALCRSHDFRNLYLVDGATFPFLPAKNLTFTLMANAVRVAEGAFR